MTQSSGLMLLSNAATAGMIRDGSDMQPPFENVSPAEPLSADQEKKEKESFLMFTRVLMK